MIRDCISRNSYSDHEVSVLGDNDKPEHLSVRGAQGSLLRLELNPEKYCHYIKNSKNKKTCIIWLIAKKKKREKNSENTAAGCIQDEQSWYMLKRTQS